MTGFTCTPIAEPFRSARHGDAGEPIRPIRRALQVVDYLESYAARFDIQPVFNTDGFLVSGATVRNGARIRRGPGRRAGRGDRDRHRRCAVSAVLAGIGSYSRRRHPQQRISQPGAFAGKRVLVVGFGNSGGEIALDLANAGVDVAMAVRGPVQIIAARSAGLSDPVMGDPVPAVAGAAWSMPSTRRCCGSRSVRFEKLGLRRAAKGPRQMVEEDGRVPLIDIGTLDKIRDGSIKMRGGIERFTPDGVVFADATSEPFDAVILATGFRPDLRRLIPDIEGVFDRARHAARDGTGDRRARALFLRADHVADRAVARDRT